MSEVMRIWDQGAHLHDEIYAQSIPYHRSHQAIVDLLPTAGSLRILDLGAGTGLLSQRLLKRIPGSSVTCVDFSPRMIAQCQHRLEQYGSRAELLCADIRDWIPPTSYDAVVACNSLVYKEIDVGKCYSKYAEALRPGGVLLNSTVVKQEDDATFRRILNHEAASATVRVRSREITDFARGPGRRIAHFGDGSLAVALSVAEHVALVADARLTALCVWHYLSQAVIAGRKSTSE